ncbi:hypothetical protein, partial [Streptomyces galilaeus]|uniref:hypothetical protein n=1 Tax=Streptomyces galilaeus TaxID=33899 RepID=UPI0038F752CB
DPWDDDFFIESKKAQATPCIYDSVESMNIDNFLKIRYHYLNIRFSLLMPPYGDTSSYASANIENEYRMMMALTGKTIVKGWAA